MSQAFWACCQTRLVSGPAIGRAAWYLHAEARRAVRQEKSKPIVDALFRLLTARLALVSAKSKLADAIRYTWHHRLQLRGSYLGGF